MTGRSRFVADLGSLIAVAFVAACSGERAPQSNARAELVPPASLRLLVVSDIEGVLEPCGCTSRPAGGLDRLGAAIAQHRAVDLPTVVLVAGTLWAAGDGEALGDVIRKQTLTEALQRMRVDLKVVEGAIDLPGPFRLEVRPTSRPRTDTESNGLVVWTGSDAAGAEVAGRQLWIRAGHHTEGLMVVDLWAPRASAAGWRIVRDARGAAESPSQNVAWPRYVALDSNAPRDPEVRRLLDDAFSRIGALNTERDPIVREPKPGQARYVGSDSCGACHTPAYRWWIGTPHGRAFETLVARKRSLDLECVRCHVTGFEQPGGSSLTQLDHYRGVGCESCHGPGSLHASNPQSRTIAREVPPRVCGTCHDPEHSDAFVYARARARLLVPVHGLPPSKPTAAGR